MWKFGCAISGLVIGAGPALAAGQAQQPAPATQTATPVTAPAPASAPVKPATSAPAQPARQSSTPTRAEMEAAARGEDAEEIVVTGQVPRGSVPGDIPPEQTLTAADVRAYGVNSVSELLDQLSAQTGSARGRGGGMPVILLNGRRISSFTEIRDLPTEAIARVEILPEEAALKLGYSADQRVVNFVLRPRFRAITGQLSDSEPMRGGNNSKDGQVDILRITNTGRINLDVHYTGNSAITENERNVAPTLTTPYAFADGSNDTGAYRTLTAAQHDLAINGVYNRALSQKVQATLNLRLESSGSQALVGPTSASLALPVGNPFSTFSQPVIVDRYFDQFSALKRDINTNTGHVGLSVNGDIAKFRWSVTGNYDYSNTLTVTDTGIDPRPLNDALAADSTSFNPFGPVPAALISPLPSDQSRNTTNTGQLDAVIAGPTLKLPAGHINVSFRVGGATLSSDSESLRSGVTTSGKVSRNTASSQLNVDVPLTSRREKFLDAIGDLGLNGNIAVQHLSDFGTLVTYGYGVNWSPIAPVRLIASVTEDHGAPSAAQIGDPVVSTPNVRVYDFARGETVDVTTVTGGNPDLTKDHRHVFKLGVNIRPFTSTDLNIRADYTRSTIHNAIGALPTPTAEIEAAFPTRFLRDGAGQLTRIDERAVNFERTDSDQLRWGFNLSLPLKSSLAARIQRAVEARRKQVADAVAAGKPVPPVDPSMFRGLPFDPRRAQQFQQRQGQQGQPGQPGQPGQAAPPQPGAAGMPVPPAGQQQQPPQGAPQGGFFGGGGGFGGGGPGGPGGPGGGGFRGGGGGGLAQLNSPNGPLAGRMMFSLFHTWHFREDVLIRPGLPELDLLNGSATGNNGGQARHEIDASGGYFKDGIGTRVTFHWQSGTHVNGGIAGSGDTLNFAPLGTVNASIFANLGQQVGLVRKHPFFQGSRIELSLTNVLDAHLHVTDQTGAVPLSYQPDLIDPVGRAIKLSLRKLFF